MANIIKIPCLKVIQPLGEFLVCSIDYNTLLDITYTDMRRIEQEENGELTVYTYLGIQRKLNDKRVKEIAQYIETRDACFPTGIILAIPDECLEFDMSTNTLTIKEYINEENPDLSIEKNRIAQILDGQHRIEGLKQYIKNSGILLDKKRKFDINISIFPGIDLPDQAIIFSSINLAQTKVNKSLAYDLYELAKTRSPQKLSHNLTVLLDEKENSPFYKRIKRLGVSTPVEGREQETITQAAIVQGIMQYLCENEVQALKDIAAYQNNRRPEQSANKKLIFRSLMIENRDYDIAMILWAYFNAVKAKWSNAWDNKIAYSEDGEQKIKESILCKTAGYKALSRLLHSIYTKSESEINAIFKDSISEKEKLSAVEKLFIKYFDTVTIDEINLTKDVYLPGTTGENKLYADLKAQMGL